MKTPSPSPLSRSNSIEMRVMRKAAVRKSPARSLVVASGEPVTGVPDSAPEEIRRAIPVNKTSGSKPRMLWIGDALVPTGFATVTHRIVEQLQARWDVVVSGVNYDGAPHRLPYRVMPAWQGGDMWGIDRFPQLCAEFDPDIVVINNDWWNVARFAAVALRGLPLVGYMPVDGGNLAPVAMRQLNKLAAAVWYTGFGHREAAISGFKGACHVIPHGLDEGTFKPARRAHARRRLGLPADAFIVGNVNRNQPRKRLDVTIQIFAEWVKRHRVREAKLLLHCAKKDTGWDLESLARRYGVGGRLILTGGDEIREMSTVSTLRDVYASLDVQMSTTLGEGWGLTTMEGMACGVPQIVPDYAALGEWAVPAVKVPCSRQLVHPEINTIGALVDEAPFIDALQSLYKNAALRSEIGKQGIAHVAREQYRWSSVACRFDRLLASLCPKSSSKPSAQKHAALRFA